VAVASGDLHWEALLKANFEAVPMSVPIIALSFVYQVVRGNLIISNLDSWLQDEESFSIGCFSYRMWCRFSAQILKETCRE
jgi:hypothetical protein